MSQIKQLILLHQQGKGKKMIARTLGMSRNTVRTYLEKLREITSVKQGKLLTLKDLIKLENPELETKFHAGNPAYKDNRYDHFKDQIDFYLKELKRTGVNKKLLWEEYRHESPDGYSYSQFCWHIQQHTTKFCACVKKRGFYKPVVNMDRFPEAIAINKDVLLINYDK